MRYKKNSVWLAGLVVLCGLGLGSGCGYSVRPPFNPDVRTIYVPVFKSYRFRQDLNIQLTKLLVQEIQDRTTYRIVTDPAEADATLEGIVTFDDKNALVENPYNLPRHIMGTITVKVKLIDNRAGTRPGRKFPEAIVSESTTFDPEIGESTAAGFNKVMVKIARDIVNMLEDPWGPEYQARDRLTLDDDAKDTVKDDASARTRR